MLRFVEMLASSELCANGSPPRKLARARFRPSQQEGEVSSRSMLRSLGVSMREEPSMARRGIG